MSADKHPVVVTASQQLIREQLDRMLVSPIFLRADRISKLLRHVVEKTLAGQESDLTEKKITENSMATTIFLKCIRPYGTPRADCASPFASTSANPSMLAL
jgi:hypothetical protein